MNASTAAKIVLLQTVSDHSADRRPNIAALPSPHPLFMVSDANRPPSAASVFKGPQTITQACSEPFYKRLSALVDLLASSNYVGFITSYLTDEQSFARLFSQLPPTFVQIVENNPDQLDTLPSHHVTQLLEMATVAANEGRPSQQSLSIYFDTLCRVFDKTTFVPKPSGIRLYGLPLRRWRERDESNAREAIFAELMSLYQSIWQRDIDNDQELSWLGANPATNPEILNLVAHRHGFTYTPFQSQRSSMERDGSNRGSQKVRNPFKPAWREYCYTKDSTHCTLKICRFDAKERGEQIEILEQLQPGYYSFEKTLLYINRISENTRYQIHHGPQLNLNFSTAEELYEYCCRNYNLTVIYRPLAHSPQYLIKKIHIPISNDDLTKREREALKMFGLDISDLQKPDELNLDSLFRKLSPRFHPDQQGSEELFKKFLEARGDVTNLLDTIKRKRTRNYLDCKVS